MFEFITDEEERGQVGIGTLIVFIAMVLVAAIAAGVLINTAGFLQSKSQETGQQSSKQVSDRVQEVATVGNVDSNGEIDIVNVTVTQAPGAGEIDIQNATVTWIGPTGTYQLVSTTDNYDNQKPANQEFSYSSVKDADDSGSVLNDADDRLKLVFDISTYAGTDNNLGEGEEVTIKVNTMAGATTEIRFTVPESLGNKEAVEL
ncbi:archaellin/type IV pilin N-terminal domain-containing protein [Halobaculum rubrum]|uniref:archaellin/type IV pilin N-terminal domain-containing protein n=1 Tax=Halobaculum rubrum TaxID=2872158 RepID=UPI001CA3C51D|nr:archaellin/type IV pilin N-terminal domain-containing protein [Halobaculum rubrum]QZY00803.1 flagellin [Halobaculum rubrum]